MKFIALLTGICIGLGGVLLFFWYQHADQSASKTTFTLTLPPQTPLVTQPDASIPTLPIIDSKMTLDEAIGNSKVPNNVRQQLMLVDVQYYSFDNLLHQGQLVVHQSVAAEVSAIFAELKEHYVLIEKIIPVSKYDHRDEQSMQDNNTSAFNYRRINNSRKLSNHAYGLAIDINPLYNPFIGRGKISPANASYDPTSLYAITHTSPIYQTFTRYGWRWGGNWQTIKDYQHFEKPN